MVQAQIGVCGRISGLHRREAFLKEQGREGRASHGRVFLCVLSGDLALPLVALGASSGLPRGTGGAEI